MTTLNFNLLEHYIIHAPKSLYTEHWPYKNVDACTFI